MPYSQPIPTVPVYTLEAGQKFAKVLMGAPCITPLQYITTYDDVTEAETSDGRIKTMNKFTLVYPLN